MLAHRRLPSVCYGSDKTHVGQPAAKKKRKPQPSIGKIGAFEISKVAELLFYF